MLCYPLLNSTLYLLVEIVLVTLTLDHMKNCIFLVSDNQNFLLFTSALIFYGDGLNVLS